MMFAATLRSKFAGFRRNEEGSVTIEALIMIPILVWSFMAGLTYFDAYRAEYLNTKAALTIADMYSREPNDITPAYLNGTRELLKYMTRGDDTPGFRVTQVRWQASRNRHRVVWSRNRSSRGNIKNSTVHKITPHLPNMADGERMLIIETWLDYEPTFKSGFNNAAGAELDKQEFSSFVTMSPRFAAHICWNSSPGDVTKQKC